MKKPVVIISILFLILGCASSIKMIVTPTPKLEADFAVNPKILAKINTIAVLPFKDSDKSKNELLPSPPFPKGTKTIRYPYSNDGEIISDTIAKQLIKSFQYEVVDRQNLKTILEEQNLQLSGVIDESTAIKFGKFIGADGIFIGEVNKCLYGKQWKYKRKAYITQEIAILNFNFKILHAESGQLAAIVHHELTSRNLLDAPVEMVNTVITENPGYYQSYFKGLDSIIKISIKESLRPIIESRRSSLKKF